MKITAKLHAEDVNLRAALSADARLDAVLNTSVQTAGNFSLGHALMWDKQGHLAVQVANEAEEDNTLPITAAAVHTELGNIEILLQTI